MSRAHSVEEYLEAIYVLDAEGELVLPSKLADHLNVSRPTVTQTIQRMTASGFVRAHAGKEIELTPEGRAKAEAMVRKHRLLERWLTDELGLDWADAHVEAARLENSISPLVEEQLYARLGQPTTCPHGNVIPGTNFTQPPGVALSIVEPGETVEVVRIVEIAEEDLDLLRFLHKTGIVPGASITRQQFSSPYEAGIPIVVNDAQISLESAVAARVLVIPTTVDSTAQA